MATYGMGIAGAGNAGAVGRIEAEYRQRRRAAELARRDPCEILAELVMSAEPKRREQILALMQEICELGRARAPRPTGPRLVKD